MTVNAFAKIEHLVPRERQHQLLGIFDTIGRIRSNSSDPLKFSNDLAPSLDVSLIYESAKKVKQTNPGRFGAIVVDLRVCTSVSRRKRRKERFSQEPPVLNKPPSYL